MSNRLLIIEDDAALNQMLQLHFEDNGFTVAGVPTCRKDWRCCREAPSI